MFETGVAVVERDPAIESLLELDFCSRKAEAPVLGRDLESTAVPLHDIVVADDAFVAEAQMRWRSSGAGRQAWAVSRGVRAKRRL